MMKALILLSALLSTATLSGCFNDNRAPSDIAGNDSSTSSSKNIATVKGNAVGAFSFTIVNALVNQALGGTGPSGPSGPSSTPTMSIFFNAVSSVTLNDVCQAQGGAGGTTNPSKTCKCRYQWVESNLSDSSAINRTVDTSISQVTSFQVQCPVPDVFNNEISDGTNVKITVVPDVIAGNNSGFLTNIFNFKKTSSGSTGEDFRDSEGRSFKNIFHYVCFDKFQTSLSIRHNVKVATQNAQGQNVEAPLANGFVLGQGGQATSFSAQSYYFDFYVRSNETGSINSNSASFTCPQANVNGVPSFFPMDTTFALALNTSKDFTIPVQSRIVIALPTAGGGTTAANNTLGFAAKPNSDGTCPAFTDSTGKIRRTFRLRQYSSVYPVRYDARGEVLDTSQPFNVVYVIDRPVDKSGQDSLKPITRLGPKPCPFSFKTAQFGQKCSTDASLAGYNINGTQIDGDAGCPVFPPVRDQHLKPDGTLVIRPYKPFLAHFIENTSFKACAFQSSVPVDPEIVLSHDATIFPNPPGPNDFYCAKHYPSPGAAIPPSSGDPFDKMPGDCDLASAATAIKTDQTYSCAKTFDPSGNARITPAAGCCQICSGANCQSAGGGLTPPGRNLVFTPPQDNGLNPTQAMKLVPRAIPNKPLGNGCFDPSED